MTNTLANTDHHSIQKLGLFICLVALIAVSFSIGLRIEPSFLQNDLQRAFHLSPNVLSELVVRYQYSLIATLLFAGVIVDYFGPGRVLTIAIIVAIAGNYLFGNASSVPSMIHGRMLIGYAHPFILISALKLGTIWLPRKRFSFFVGILFAVLLMTPSVLKNDLAQLANLVGMSTFTNLFDIIGILLILILFLTRQQQSQFGTSDIIKPRDALAILTNTKIWVICIISCLGWIANTFLLNYGMIFLISNLAIPHAIAAETINIVFECFALGAVLMGMLAESLHKKRLLIAIGYLIAAITFCILLYVPHISLFVASGLIFATGFFAGTAVICYSKAYDFCIPANAGCAFALIAFITTLGNTLFTLCVGNLLQAEQLNQHIASSTTWQVLLALIPSALAIGAILALRLRKNETPTSS
jgi:predicted MFS family arabinose efflux permease